MTGSMLLLALAMGLSFAAQFHARPEERPRSPVDMFLSGGYWFTALTRTGQLLLATSWLLAFVALFRALSDMGLLR